MNLLEANKDEEVYHMSMRKGWERWGCSAWRMEGLEGSDQCMPIPDWRWEMKKTEPDSSHCSPVPGEEAMSIS